MESMQLCANERGRHVSLDKLILHVNVTETKHETVLHFLLLRFSKKNHTFLILLQLSATLFCCTLVKNRNLLLLID